MTIVQTFSGFRIDLEAPEASAAAFADIRAVAMQLSQINRWNGATSAPLNVAQHSVDVMRLVRQQKHDAATQFLALVHDMRKIGLGNVLQPVIDWVHDGMGYDRVENAGLKFDQVIHAQWGLTPLATPARLSAVHQADRSVAAAEWRDFMKGPYPGVATPAPFAIKPVPPHKAAENFLKEFDRLCVEACVRLRTSAFPTGILK